MNTTDARRVLETALICAQQPLTVRDMGALFDQELTADTIKTLLTELQQEWTQKGVELVQVATGWRFQSRPAMRPFLDRLNPEKPPKYTRATLETLAIIAYRQPVTRGDMEDIRGVTVNSLLLKQLEDRGWIEVIGHRETVGRPALFATTKQFLDDLGISSLDQLPPLEGSEVQESALDRLDLGSLQGSLQADEVVESTAASDDGAQMSLVVEPDAEPEAGPDPKPASEASGDVAGATGQETTPPAQEAGTTEEGPEGPEVTDRDASSEDASPETDSPDPRMGEQGSDETGKEEPEAGA